MIKKPGRNDPCPCGSGKKYKKCCGRDGSVYERLKPPDDENTGTPLDAFLDLIPVFAIVEEKIIRFDPDGPALKKTIRRALERFRPGEENGLLNSHFAGWEYFDNRFGPRRRTIAEAVLSERGIDKVGDQGLSRLHRLAESYPTFYEVLEEGPEAVVLDELGTGRLWHVFYFRELFDTPPVKGEIWYTRLIGPPEDALPYSTPYVFPSETRAQFKRGVEAVCQDFLKDPLSIGVPGDRFFAESQKATSAFWMEYIRVGNADPNADLSSLPSTRPNPPIPHIVNTDKEEILFTDMHFRIKDESRVRRKLARLKSFEHNEKEDLWVWLKAPSQIFPDKPRVEQGHFRIKDGFLVAETNSRERALRLENKLKGFFGGAIALEKTLYRTLDDLPQLSPEEREKARRENEEFNARPEVREALLKEKERYYCEEWPRVKVPALGHVTPLQAAKTERGRRKLIDLLDEFDRRLEADPSQPRIDFGKLRRLLGLPEKSH